MFPALLPCDVSREAIDALVALMGTAGESSTSNPCIPAGFTYLGQFIDHDITFDPTPLSRRADAHALVNFRTPRLDLDSVYGSGPEAQPYLYDWQETTPRGARLLTERNALGAVDLPRNHHGRALIGDARNDENLIVAQLHLLFIRFHNAVVDHLAREGTPDEDLFERAQQLVRWHHQWIVAHEFLTKVAGARLAKDVLRDGGPGAAPTVHRRFFRWGHEPFMPLEFSGAAYRFGHSMVRRDYGIKRLEDGRTGRQPISIHPDLAGFRPLPAELVIDWERFFELEEPPSRIRQEQLSMRIDTSIASPLFTLPDGHPELPRRNLLRGRKLGLPSGQDVACVMHEPALTDEALHLHELPENVRDELRHATPLWFYVLCEAAQERAGGEPGPAGKRLGPVGGRIVAEVLVGLIEGDPESYLSRRPAWRPGELGTGQDFTMAHLVDFVRRSRARTASGAAARPRPRR